MPSFLLKLLLPVAAFVGGLCLAQRWDAGDIQALHAHIATIERDDARAKAAAVADAMDRVAREDRISLAGAVAEAAAQQKLADENSRIAGEVQRHVSESSHFCIPYGLVRVLDAASLGADPDGLSLPAGQSDDSCAPVDAAHLAANVAANYAAARENAEQLSALQAWVKAEEAVSSE